MLVPFRYLSYLIIENLGSLLIYLLQVLSLSTESWSYASICFSHCIIPSVFCLLIGCKMTTTFRFFNSLTRTFHVSASLHFFRHLFTTIHLPSAYQCRAVVNLFLSELFSVFGHDRKGLPLLIRPYHFSLNDFLALSSHEHLLMKPIISNIWGTMILCSQTLIAFLKLFSRIIMIFVKKKITKISFYSCATLNPFWNKICRVCIRKWL